MNKWILSGSLGAVFLITLTFAYGPGYGGGLFAFLGSDIGKTNDLSPSDMVTSVVTPKTLVTFKNVTNVTSVSPLPGTADSKAKETNGSYSPELSPMVSPNQTTSPLPSFTSSPLPVTTTPQAAGNGQPSTTGASKIVINEIAWMGTSAGKTGSDEWIELYNYGETDVNLSGWILISETDDSPHINLNGTIRAGGYYLIERTDDTTISDIQANYVGSFGTGGLKNDGEILVLKDKVANTIDRVDCSQGWFYGDNVTKSSMERHNPGTGGSEKSNWATNNHLIRNGVDASGNPINGTPSSRNSVQ